RRDVAMEDALAMQHLERVEQRLGEGDEPGLVRRRGHAHADVLERRARVVLHRHVRGVVGAPEAVHLDQRRMVEAGEQPGLAEERVEAALERRRELGRAQLDGQTFAAAGERRRHVLLDRDATDEDVVVREVHDAERADAEHAQHLELVEPRSRRERVVERGPPRPRRVAGLGDRRGPGAVGHWPSIRSAAARPRGAARRKGATLTRRRLGALQPTTSDPSATRPSPSAASASPAIRPPPKSDVAVMSEGSAPASPGASRRLRRAARASIRLATTPPAPSQSDVAKLTKPPNESAYGDDSTVESRTKSTALPLRVSL